jgi:hypothetical protein
VILRIKVYVENLDTCHRKKIYRENEKRKRKCSTATLKLADIL